MQEFILGSVLPTGVTARLLKSFFREHFHTQPVGVLHDTAVC